jgi:hypothetical protein
VSFSNSNRAKLAYLAETAWASTPSSGSPREMRIKTSKLTIKKETKMSDEIRADRMVSSIIEVGAASEGEIDFEFSAGAIDDFLASFVYGAWSRPQTMDFWEGNVAVTSTSNITISSTTDYSGYLVAGRRIKLEGFNTPANNGYFEISAVAFAGGLTAVTVVGTALVVEVASASTKLFDANDVIVLNNTAIRFGTAGASAIDSNGTNAFASAIAAGQIKVGQKLYVDGLGFDVGTVTYTAAAAVGDTVSVNDGVKQVTFEAGGSTVAGHIEFNPGADETATAAALVVAISAAYAAGKINVTAKSALGVLTVANLQATGGHLSKVEAGALATVVDFTGGDDTLRGVFTVTSAADDVLGVSPAPNTNANGATKKVTIKGSMLRNPARPQDFVEQSYTIETSYEDVNQYFVNKGLRVGQFELDVQSREIVTGKIHFKGESMARSPSQTSKFDNAPYTAKVSTPGQIMSATTNVGNIEKNGVPLATAIKSITINGDAALREQQAVGHKFPVGIGVGRFKLTGKFDAYFETGEMFDHFLAHDTVSLSWYFKDLDNQRYDVTLPAIKLTEDPLSPGGIDQDVMESISWEAQRDPATNSIIQFDRFSSVLAPANAA